jgi:hypothetical protein
MKALLLIKNGKVQKTQVGLLSENRLTAMFDRDLN